ncbi:GDSL-type esterase/lipase family protein [Pseudonocardia benzenivorans]|uniref:GDSL-type esterase/lipase family protein n=1 Tax=Pseudonocardia benzenivorans TaxID=228005 RepID=A0ABW3VIH3_9PSEU
MSTVQGHDEGAARKDSGLSPRGRAVPTLVLVVIVLLVGLPVVAVLTPAQHVRILGQDVAVGARVPGPSLSGPAQLVQLGNTAFDLRGVEVYGPVRPRVALGPIRRGDAAAAATELGSAGHIEQTLIDGLVGGFVTWLAWGALGIGLFALAASGLVGSARLLLALRHAARTHATDAGVGELAARSSRELLRMTAIALVVGLVGWGASGAAAYVGTTRGLQGVSSLSDLVGNADVTPSPVGPPVFGYSGAVLGDSRVARVGGPLVADATPQDTACERSVDSPAVELARMTGTDVLNLSCSGASVAEGLRGPQVRDQVSVPPQIGRLKQVQNLDWVVVAIGPNDVHWSDLLQYCYGLPRCDDRLAAGEFDLRMARFDRDYSALLADLAALPGTPRVVIMQSYDPFPDTPTPDCPDLHGPAGVPGLDAGKVALLSGYNDRLNAVLATGAEKYGFAVVRPVLTPLCTTAADRLGPDLLGLATAHAFHPTGLGSLRIAAALLPAINATSG